MASTVTATSVYPTNHYQRTYNITSIPGNCSYHTFTIRPAAELFPQGFYRLVPVKVYVTTSIIEIMSLPFSGTKTKSSGVVSAIRKQLLQLDLKPVKRVLVKFDPFGHNAITSRYVFALVL